MRSTSRYFSFIAINLVNWKSKKQSLVVARLSVEAKYKAMAHTTCESLWLKSLLSEIGMNVTAPLMMYCDNQVAIYIASNLEFHEHTKHIEVDCHFIHDLAMSKQIVTLLMLNLKIN